jgi:hypothetical protein
VLGDHIGAGRPWRLAFEPVVVEPAFLFVLCDNRRACPPDERMGLVPASAVVGVAKRLLRAGDARVKPLRLDQGEVVPLTAGPLPEPASSGPPLK